MNGHEEQEQFREQTARAITFRRRYAASIFETSVYIGAFFLSLVVANSHENKFGDQFRDISYPISILTNTYVLFFGSVLTLAVFSFLLTGRTPLVNAVTSGNLQAMLGKAKGPMDLIAVLGKVMVTSDEHIEARRPQPTQADDAEVNFLAYLSRSQEAARVAQRRPNALLFFGTFVALRPVYSHRLARKAATRLMSPAKQASVFS